MENNCIEKLFGSTVFWVLMGLQAAGTGGFLILAVTMDIKYIDEEDSPEPAFITLFTLFAIPVACFCFVFAGASFFNVFHKCSSKKSSFPSSFPSLIPTKNKISSSFAALSTPQDSQSLV